MEKSKTLFVVLVLAAAALLSATSVGAINLEAAGDDFMLGMSDDRGRSPAPVFVKRDDERHHVTARQAINRNNRVTDTSAPPNQELERKATTDSTRSGVHKRVYVENKYRPVFSKCESATLAEGMQPGTHVTNVKAYDNDTDSAGEIFYTIVRAGAEKEFDVDPATGDIKSAKSFDRDEPAREKIVYVTIKATDRGTPPLEAICTFNVTIEDINDNAPMFDKSIFEGSIPRDAEVNRTVMRIAATDVDAGDNARITYNWDPSSGMDADYFDLDRVTGIVHLKKKITQPEGFRFSLAAIARDNGQPSQQSQVRVVITVASSKVKPPYFTSIGSDTIHLKENYTSYKTPIATLTAQSNVAEPDLYFELVKGQTEQTNSDETFRIIERGNSVDILLAKALDYEKVTQYMLTVRVKNAEQAAAETVLVVSVEDVNDESPTFTAVDGGSVLENSAPGTFVLKVQATDKDATYPNNWVRYELRDNKDKFDIDRNTGDIRTLIRLDREERKSYPLTVVAYDGAESALTLDGKPNENAKRFQIEVADVNDNPPYFPQSEYFAEVAEDADIGAKVSEVTAQDNDTDSQLTYDIVNGNLGGVFYIESQTGLLKVQKPLDYETTKSYDLIVEVDDGKQKATTKVHVKILNVNDNKPQFKNSNPETIKGVVENTVPSGPIITISATDPDYDSSTAPGPMKITYTLSGSHADFFTINQLGELSIVKPLDRDLPAGRKDWSVYVVAQDELDGVRLENTLEVIVVLDDVNDNAPFLETTRVVWRENQPPGRIAPLNASDYDEPHNGPPFNMRMAETAEDDVKASFRVDGSIGTSWSLMATRTFDREARKEFAVPIVITDSGRPAMSATSTLTVVIGDENDNPMSDGSSAILVYNYRNALPDTEIGRVYVTDLDDWDLPDKTFAWSSNHIAPPHFTVTAFGGFITMKAGTPPGIYTLRFHVRDNVRQEEADATVTVTVKEITEEAVRRSGSIRLTGMDQDEFVRDSPSKKDVLQKKIAEYVGAFEENVDVFTVMSSSPSRNHSVDIRYSAHGSPYYEPSKLNGLTATHQDELERLLDAEVAMFGIDECLYEKRPPCSEGSCTNRLKIGDQPYKVTTNTSSFVGVDARIVPECVCLTDSYLTSSTCSADACFNGGTCTGDASRPCICPDGYFGPRCEGLDISFTGTGWAWYDPLPTCSSGYLSLSILSATHNGLILYAGPTAVPPDTTVTDFLAVELHEGTPVVYLDLGSGTRRLELGDRSRTLVDGKRHDLEVSWDQRSVRMRIDQCQGGQAFCSASAGLMGANEYLNVNGPLQLGGITADLQKIRLALNWDSIPTDIGFSGCIQNLTFNGMTYDLVAPGFYKNATPSCAGAVMPYARGAFGWELILIIIVLLILLLVVIIGALAYRKRLGKNKTGKDINDDIRENIINYSDEGGGEGDMTGYDLSVLRMASDGRKPLIGPNDDYRLKDNDFRPERSAPGQVPDISRFLDDNKGRVDRDPDGLAFDDLRHYAYEGEGNSLGSLSSLASGTDDGDLDFECLSDFGPRFKKLADMYGDNSSDSDEDGADGRQGAAQSGSESWC